MPVAKGSRVVAASAMVYAVMIHDRVVSGVEGKLRSMRSS